MTFYSEAQSTGTRLLKKFNQGTVRYLEPGEPTGPDYDPTPGTPTPYDVSATVRGVAQQYVQDGYINATDLQVNIGVFGARPTTSGTLEIDGKQHQIIRVDAVPGAGTVIVWRVFCKS